MLEELTKYAESSKEKIKSFSDMRIVGLQAITNLTCSHAGKYSHFNSADVTEFFRLNESFGKGYGIWNEYLGDYLENRLNENKHLRKDLELLFTTYKNILKGENDSIFGIVGDVDAILLHNKKFMDSKYSNMFSGKNIIVTGSNTGIGRAIALEFARRGAEKIVLHYPTGKFSRGALSATELMEEYGKQAKAFEGDFRREEEILEFTKKATYYLDGKVDVLVNNAGITLNKAFEEMTFKDFNNIVNVNLKGNYFVTQKVLPFMEGGTIVNLASNHAVRGMAGHSVYASTKGAIISLTNQLAIELASRRIRVNAIRPGGVAVANHFQLLPESDFTKTGEENTPFGLDTPESFVKSVMYLASDESSSVTGITLDATRGLHNGMSTDRNCTIVGKEKWGEKYL